MFNLYFLKQRIITNAAVINYQAGNFLCRIFLYLKHSIILTYYESTCFFFIFNTLFCINWFMVCPEYLVMVKLSVTFCTWILHFLHFALPGCHYLMLILFLDVAGFFDIKMFIWIPLTSQIPVASLNAMHTRVGTCFDMLNLWMCMQSYYGSAESINGTGVTGNQRLKYELRRKLIDMAFVL